MEYTVSDEVDCVYGGYPESAGKIQVVSKGKGSFLQCPVVSLGDTIVFWGVG